MCCIPFGDFEYYEKIIRFHFWESMFCELISIWRLIHGMGCSKRKNGLDKAGMARIRLYINTCSKFSIVSVAGNTKIKPALDK